MGTAENLVIATFVIVIFLIVIKANQYFNSRKTKNHDSYIVVAEKCDDGQLKYKECPRLEMWGFKMSTLVILLIFNLILTVYLIYIHFPKKK